MFLFGFVILHSAFCIFLWSGSSSGHPLAPLRGAQHIAALYRGSRFARHPGYPLPRLRRGVRATRGDPYPSRNATDPTSRDASFTLCYASGVEFAQLAAIRTLRETPPTLPHATPRLPSATPPAWSSRNSRRSVPFTKRHRPYLTRRLVYPLLRLRRGVRATRGDPYPSRNATDPTSRDASFTLCYASGVEFAYDHGHVSRSRFRGTAEPCQRVAGGLRSRPPERNARRTYAPRRGARRRSRRTFHFAAHSHQGRD